MFNVFLSHQLYIYVQYIPVYAHTLKLKCGNSTAKGLLRITNITVDENVPRPKKSLNLLSSKTLLRWWRGIQLRGKWN